VVAAQGEGAQMVQLETASFATALSVCIHVAATPPVSREHLATNGNRHVPTAPAR
jgi:hypothetical protein